MVKWSLSDRFTWKPPLNACTTMGLHFVRLWRPHLSKAAFL
jgi:hypothetical protein